MKNKTVVFVSIGVGGTKGHLRLIDNLVAEYSEYESRVVISEENYQSHTENKFLCSWIEVPLCEHVESCGGAILYDNYQTLTQIILSNKPCEVVFSTFFDERVVNELRSYGVRCVFYTYPMRDSHGMYFLNNSYNELFHELFVLEDLFTCQLEQSGLFSKVKLNYLKNLQPQSNRKATKNVLVTCGGGGRPSSRLFHYVVSHLLKEFDLLNSYEVTVLADKSKVQQAYGPKVNFISWTNDMTSLFEEHNIVISEAGYYSIQELYHLRKFSFILPGQRRVDNQELRASYFEKRGLGVMCYPDVGLEQIQSKFNEYLMLKS